MRRRTISLSDRASVVDADVGAATTSTVGDAVSVGFDSHVAVSRLLIGKTVHLFDRAVVGNIRTDRLTAPLATHGTVTPFAPPPAVPAVAVVAAGTTDITVPGAQTVTIAPGSYRQITRERHCAPFGRSVSSSGSPAQQRRAADRGWRRRAGAHRRPPDVGRSRSIVLTASRLPRARSSSRSAAETPPPTP